MTWQAHALRYARRDATAAAHFIGGDPHDGPMPMDYFLWVIRGAGRVRKRNNRAISAGPPLPLERGRQLARTQPWNR